MKPENMVFTRTRGTLTEEMITKAEKKLGITLPEDYKAFLMRNNGGHTKPEMLFDFFDGTCENDNTSVIRRFFAIYPESVEEGELPCRKDIYDDLIYNCLCMRDEEIIPLDIIPIADDPGGNVICMNVSKENGGKVYFANHEFEDDDTGYLWMDEIAPSFTAFLEKLYPDTENE